MNLGGFKPPGHRGRPTLQRLDEKEFQTGTAPPEDPYQGIRCPKCRWRPTKDSRWVCNRPFEGRMCFNTWNTFDTRGLCRRCGHQWVDTICLQCHRWSAHEDWYFARPEE